MPKSNDQKIIERLANDHSLEMMPDELTQKLNAELEKPADEIDTGLVREILKATPGPAPDPRRMQEDWAKVKASLPKRQARRWIPRRIMRLATAAAAMIIVVLMTMSDAQAFRLSLIQKVLKPVAQTFGIVIDDQTELTPEVTDAPVYTVEDAPSETIAFASLSDVPEAHDGCAIRPRWLPEGFAFAGGSHFSSIDSEIYSLVFTNGESEFSLLIHIYTYEYSVASYEYERTLDIPIEKNIGNHAVTFYNNAHDDIQSASWVCENAHYLLSGEIASGDIIQFVIHMEE